MKKRIIALLSIVLIFAMLLCACESTPPEPEIINSEKMQTTVGSYSIFRSKDVQQYLNFLENFDEKKYEIIDISVNDGYHSASDEIYLITYKTIAE